MIKYSEEDMKICNHLQELQIKNIELHKNIVHKRIAIDVIGLTASIIPLTFTYGEKTIDIKNDFPFYIEKDKVHSIEKDIEAFGSSNMFIIKYLFDKKVYDLIFICPVKAILV